ncbi:hypothetical protein ABZP36_015746 [Zizania latifolia]
MDECRELGLTVPGALMLVATGMESLKLIEVAQRKLDEHAKLIRRLRQGSGSRTPAARSRTAPRSTRVSYAKLLGSRHQPRAAVPELERPLPRSHPNHRRLDEALGRVSNTASQAEAAKEVQHEGKASDPVRQFAVERAACGQHISSAARGQSAGGVACGRRAGVARPLRGQRVGVEALRGKDCVEPRHKDAAAGVEASKRHKDAAADGGTKPQAV